MNRYEFERFLAEYNTDSNYQLNAKSFFHYLGKSNQALKYLSKRIWEYDEKMGQQFDEWTAEMKDRLDDWDDNLQQFPSNVESLLQDWMSDGTLDHIINETIFNWKVDQTEFDEFENKTTTQLAQKVNVIQTDLLVTVGSNGDFNSINEAIDHLSKMSKPKGFTVEILILSGFVVREQILLYDIDLSWIQLSSESNPVIVDPEYLTTDFFIRGGEVHRPLFGGTRSKLPYINGILFDFQDVWEGVYRDGLAIRENSTASFNYGTGFLNVGGDGLYASYNSDISGMDFDVSGAGRNGFRVRHGSSINARSAKANDVGEDGINAYGGSKVWYREGEVKRAGKHAIKTVLSSVDAYGSDLSESNDTTIDSQEGKVNLTYAVGRNAKSKVISGSNASEIIARYADFSTLSTTEDACYISEATSLIMPLAKISGGRNSIRAEDSSTLKAPRLTTKGSGVTSINMMDSSQAYISKSNIEEGILAQNGSHISANGTTANQFRVSESSVILASNVTGDLYNTPNEITSSGYILTNS